MKLLNCSCGNPVEVKYEAHFWEADPIGIRPGKDGVSEKQKQLPGVYIYCRKCIRGMFVLLEGKDRKKAERQLVKGWNNVARDKGWARRWRWKYE